MWSEGISPALKIITKIWTNAWDSIKAAWDKWGAPIFDTLRDAIENVGDVFATWWEKILKPIWDNFMQMVDWLWSKHLKPLLDNFLDFVGEFIKGALDIYNGFIAPLVQWFTNTFGPSISRVVNTVVNIFGSLVATVADVANGVITIFKGIVQFLVGVFTLDWEKAWTGIVNVFKGIFQGVGGIVKGVVNIVIDLINGMIGAVESAVNWIIDKVNSLSSAVSPVVNIPSIPTVSLPRIPKLAKGGVLSSETLFIGGEYPGASSNPEIVSPKILLETYKEASWMIVDAFLEGTEKIVKAIDQKETNTYLDGVKVSRQLDRPNKRVEKQKGKSLIV